MRPVLSYIQHNVNSGHVYCLIKRCGFCKQTAKRLAKLSTFVTNPFYRRWWKMKTEGIRGIWYAATGRMKAGNTNSKGAVSRDMGQKQVFNPALDESLAEVLENIIEIERKIKNKEMEVVRIGNVIRRRKIKREEVTE